MAGRTAVVVRARAGTKVRVRIGTRSITHRFKRKGKRLRGYVLPGDFRSRGPEALWVRGRRGSTRGFDTVTLESTRRSSSLLRVSLGRSSREAATFDLRTRTKVPKAYVRVFLNGRRLERLLEPGRPGRHHLRLSAAHGLRFGRNTVRVVAHDGRGRSDSEVRRFTVRRTRPLAGQLYQPVTVVGRPAFLDAGPSRGARGGRLVYRWTLLDRPGRSRARLRSRTGRTLRFVPDRRGKYRVRLTVRETTRKAKASAAAATPVATSDVTVGAQAPAPTGTPLSTSTTNPDSAITYGNLSVPAASGSGSIQYLLIDRTTGAPSSGVIPSPIFNPGCSDLTSLIGFVQGLPSSQLVVLTRQEGQGSCVGGMTETEIQELEAELGAALDTLGVNDPSFLNAVLGTSAFSLVGIPGMGDEEGVGNIDQDSSAASVAGIVRASPTTTYESASAPVEGPPMLRFQEQGSAAFSVSPGASSITGVGGPASTQLPAVPAGAAHLAVFDAHSLGLIDSQMTATLGTVQSFLNQYDDPSPPRVWVIRFNGLYTLNNNDESNQPQQLRAGVPGGPNPTVMLNQIVNDMETIGGNRAIVTDTIGGLDPQPYTLVALTGGDAVEGSALKASGGTATSSASVSGFFSPDGAERLSPGSGAPGFDVDLQQLLAQPPTAYQYPTDPPDSGGQYADAEAQIFNFLVAQRDVCALSQSGQSDSGCTLFLPTGIRVNYASASFRYVITTGEVTNTLACQSDVGGAPGALPSGLWPGGSPGYSLKQLEALRQQVCDEMVAIRIVEQNLFTPLRAAIQQGQGLAVQDLTAEGSLLEGLIEQTPRPAPLHDPNDAIGKSAAALNVVSGIATAIAGATAIEAPPVAAIAGVIAGAAAAVSGILSFVETFKHGSTNTVDADLGKAQITTANLIGTVQSEYADMVNRTADIEEIIFTDPTKLGIPDPGGASPLTAYARAKPAGGEFNYGADSDPVAGSMRLATDQFIAPQLIDAQPQNSQCGKTSFSPYPDNAGPMKLSAPVQFGALEFTAHRSNPYADDDAPGLNYTGSTGDQTYYPYFLPFYANFASLKLGSSQLQTLDTQLFTMPLSLSTPTDLTGSLAGYGLVREDFFLPPGSSNGNCAPYAYNSNGQPVVYTKSSKTAVPPGYTGQTGFNYNHTPPDGLPAAP